jgi:hypothetical protein
LRLLWSKESQLAVAGSKVGNALNVVCAGYRHSNLIEIVRFFIQNGIDVTATHPTSGANALMTLCSSYKGQNLFEIADMLLEAGVNVNALASNQSNALINLAIIQNSHRDFNKILRLFIQHNIDLNAWAEESWNVLHILCHRCKNPDILIEAITLLKVNGFNTQLATEAGEKPVDLVKRRLDITKKINIIKLL